MDDLEARGGSFRAVPATARPQLLLQIAAATDGRLKARLARTENFIVKVVWS